MRSLENYQEGAGQVCANFGHERDARQSDVACHESRAGSNSLSCNFFSSMDKAGTHSGIPPPTRP